MAEHNHLTRDIKPLWSGCHGCDEYHVNALQMRIAALLAERDAARAEAQTWEERWHKAAGQRDKARARVVELEQGCSSTPLQSGATINSIDAIEALIRERDAARAEADKWQTLAVAAQMARDDLLAESAQGTEDHGGR